MGTYHRFKELFDKYSKEAGKEQYLIPYFISAHPGTRDIDMLNLALWLKENNFRLDQVQGFYPSPMANATTMYHTEKNPIHKVTRKSEKVSIVKGERHRRLHRAFLRYHDPANWAMLREALKNMGKAHLIGNGPKHLVSPERKGELRGKAQKDYERNSVNKAKAKGKGFDKKKRPQKALTRFSSDQGFNKTNKKKE